MLETEEIETLASFFEVHDPVFDALGVSTRSAKRSVSLASAASASWRVRHIEASNAAIPTTSDQNTQNPDPVPCRFRYLHSTHRRRKIAARRHLVPNPIQILFQIFLDFGDRRAIAPAAP